MVSLAVGAQAQVTEILDSVKAGSTNFDPLDVVVDASGNVYVSSAADDEVLVLATDGTVSVVIDAMGDGLGNVLDRPTRLAIDAQGNVYVTGIQSDNVFKVTPSGAITEILDATGDGLGNGLDGPAGIAVSAAGNVYVAGGFSSNAFRITPTGEVTEIIDTGGDGIGSGLIRPSAIAVDGSETVYVTGDWSANAFSIRDDGTITEILDSSGDGQGNTVGAPKGVAVDGAGNVFVSDNAPPGLFEIAPSGAVSLVIGPSGDGVGTHLGIVGGVITDGAGNVFVAGSSSSTVFARTEEGVYAVVEGDDVGLSFVEGIASHPDGSSLYVVGALSHNVFEVRLPSPRARWSLDGDAVADNDPAWSGIPSPGVTYEGGRVGQAARFELDSQAVVTPCDCTAPSSCVVDPAPGVDHIDSMQSSTSADFSDGLSVMGWIRPEDGGGGVILDHSQACCGTCFLGFEVGVRQGTGVLYAELTSDAGALVAETAPTPLLDSSCWTHVAVTWNGDPAGGVRFYADGVELTSGAVVTNSGFTGLTGTGPLPTRIGASHADESGVVASFHGLIDEIGLWNGVLSPSRVAVDLDAAPPLPDTLQFGTLTPCSQVLMAAVGVPLTFDVKAIHCDASKLLTLNGDPAVSPTPNGIPVGASLSSSVLSNPVTRTFLWTPTLADQGAHDMRFVARDLGFVTLGCDVTIEVAECYLLLGAGPGGDVIGQGGHTFASQLESIGSVYPVTVDRIPEIPLSGLGRRPVGALEAPLAAPNVGTGRGATLPLDPGRVFFAQVVLWSPEVFPANPEQWSQGLAVYVLPTLELIAIPFGSENGIEISAEVGQGANGKPVLTFPFAIDGL